MAVFNSDFFLERVMSALHDELNEEAEVLLAKSVKEYEADLDKLIKEKTAQIAMELSRNSEIMHDGVTLTIKIRDER